ncbi:polysaccharide pyruvyl transferase family protein [Methyloversatilis sp. RAC08]|uniref:polysaccharide pyruvyl transferase family protein n=1 Tax=Methyloversatilis sp. RAC08 TaxID=1842540 RepID=UPI000856F601|nr:polysaccharide pyruvyl transferase family protein [Methyloversatilis sp. RAC08]AOF81989.1 polysaccharide pyruvyl transferase family protein [Methyloversatilis sp. RAC08]
MKKKIRVGLLWHSADSANLGVGALTFSQITLAERAATTAGVELEFLLIGWGRDQIAYSKPIVGSCQINFKRFSLRDRKLVDAFRSCDLVLDIGEGDSFSDIYGAKRLTYLIGSKLYALVLKKPLVMSPQTLGPFKGKIAAWCADFVMNRSRVVCSRDVLSTEYFRSRSLKARFHEAIDVAFALPFKMLEKSAGRVSVGLNVSGLLWAGGYSGKNQFGLTFDYRAMIERLVEFFIAQPDVDLYLVSHVVPDNRVEEDDLHAAREIAGKFPSVRVVDKFENPSSAKSFISGLDYFVGARMHACIAAFSSGVAVVPMAYSRKFRGLFSTLDYPYVADCFSDDAEHVYGLITRSFHERAEIATKVAEGNVKAQQRLDGYVALLAEVFEEAANA